MAVDYNSWACINKGAQHFLYICLIVSAHLPPFFFFYHNFY